MVQKLQIEVDLETGQAVSNMGKLDRAMGSTGKQSDWLGGKAKELLVSLTAVGASWVSISKLVEIYRDLGDSITRAKEAQKGLAGEARSVSQVLDILQDQLQTSRENAQKWLFQAQWAGGIKEPQSAADLMTAINSVIGFQAKPDLAIAAVQTVAPFIGRYGLQKETITNIIRSLTADPEGTTPEGLRAVMGKQLRAAYAAASSNLPAFLQELGVQIPVMAGLPGGDEDTTAASSGFLELGLRAGLSEAESQTFGRQAATRLAHPDVVRQLQQTFPDANVAKMPIFERMFLLAKRLSAEEPQEQFRILMEEYGVPERVIRSFPRALSPVGLGAMMNVADVARKAGATDVDQIIRDMESQHRMTEDRMSIFQSYESRTAGEKYRLATAARDTGQQEAARIQAEMSMTEGITLGPNEAAIVGSFRALGKQAVLMGKPDIAKEILGDARAALEDAKKDPESLTKLLNYGKLNEHAKKLASAAGLPSGSRLPTVAEAVAGAKEFGQTELIEQIRAADRAVEQQQGIVTAATTPLARRYPHGFPGLKRMEALEELSRRQEVLETLKLRASFPSIAELGGGGAADYEQQARTKLAGLGEPRGVGMEQLTVPIPQTPVEAQKLEADILRDKERHLSAPKDTTTAKRLETEISAKEAALHKAKQRDKTKKDHTWKQLDDETRTWMEAPVTVSVPAGVPAAESAGPKATKRAVPPSAPQREPQEQEYEPRTPREYNLPNMTMTWQDMLRRDAMARGATEEDVQIFLNQAKREKKEYDPTRREELSPIEGDQMGHWKVPFRDALPTINNYTFIGVNQQPVAKSRGQPEDVLP